MIEYTLNLADVFFHSFSNLHALVHLFWNYIMNLLAILINVNLLMLAEKSNFQILLEYQLSLKAEYPVRVCVNYVWNGKTGLFGQLISFWIELTLCGKHRFALYSQISKITLNFWPTLLLSFPLPLGNT